MQRECEGHKNYEKLLGEYLRDMGVRHESSDNIDDNKSSSKDYEGGIVNEEIKKKEFSSNLRILSKDRKLNELSEISRATTIDKKEVIELSNRTFKTTTEIKALKKYKICQEYEVKAFDLIFTDRATASMRIHRNTRIFYDVSKMRYGTGEYKEKIKISRSIIDKANSAKEIIDEEDKITGTQRIYQSGLCELAITILNKIKVNENDNPFVSDTKIKYDAKEIDGPFNYNKIDYNDEKLMDHIKSIEEHNKLRDGEFKHHYLE